MWQEKLLAQGKQVGGAGSTENSLDSANVSFPGCYLSVASAVVG